MPRPTFEEALRQITLDRYREWAERQPPMLTFVDYLTEERERLMRQFPNVFGLYDLEEAHDAPLSVTARRA